MNKPQPSPRVKRTVRVSDRGRVFVWNRWCNCTVLAVIEDVALVEYDANPSGVGPPRTALAFIDAFRLYPQPEPSRVEQENPNGRLDRGPGQRYLRVLLRPCTYRQLLKPWLEAVHAQYGRWIGASSAGQVPQPQELLKDRHASK